MADIIDLSTLGEQGNGWEDLSRSGDLSGRPKPENVRVILNSGVEIRCDVKYDGIDKSNNTRRYRVTAEIDWENYWPVALLVGEVCSDVTLVFKSNTGESENAWRAQNLRIVAEKIVKVN